jgi:GTP cyclohydrolase I|nr:MAG TPA: GTP cyclohydrolase I [Herelleviridae sp.]
MALDKTKTNPYLGCAVHENLIKIGVESPMVETKLPKHDERLVTITRNVSEIMKALGLDLKDDSLCETPRRIAKMYLNEIFWGLDYNNFPKITTIENKMQYDNVLLERHIKVNSTCEHHFIPMIGEAFIAYLPDKKVIGLSKINRIVEFFSRRPQVQERLTEQIFHTLCMLLETDNVAVLIKAEHTCVKLRGVEDTNSDTLTSRLGGIFFNSPSRNEFYQSIRL